MAKVDDNVLDGLRKMGWSAGAIEQFEKAHGGEQPTEVPPAEDFEVWADNWKVCMFFLSLASQWDYLLVPVGMGVMVSQRKGLNYAGCEAAASGTGMRWRRVFTDLQAMEFAVLEVEAEQRQARIGNE